jgi:hypothetical protein
VQIAFLAGSFSSGILGGALAPVAVGEC